MFKDDDEEEENTFGVTRYPCMPSLVALQQMRNRLHLAFLGRKLMKWTALATGRELRKLAGELYEVYQGFGEDLRNAFIMLARSRYFCPQLNYIVTEDIGKRAGVVVQQSTKTVSGVKIVQFEIFETEYPPYAHLGLEKGGQAILEAKKAWLDLLKRLIMMMQLRASYLMVEIANRNATKKMNVIKKIVIPKTNITIGYILTELEEMAREEFHRLKKVKEKKKRDADEREMRNKKGDSKTDMISSTCGICVVGKDDFNRENIQTEIDIKEISNPSLVMDKPKIKLEKVLELRTSPTPSSSEPLQNNFSIKEKLKYLKISLNNLIIQGKEFLQNSVNRFDVNNFLNVCQKAKLDLDQFLEPTNDSKLNDGKLERKLEHLKCHLREVIDITKEFKQETALSTSVENFIQICEAVDDKLDINKQGDVQELQIDSDEIRLLELKDILVGVEKITDAYKKQGLLSPSVEFFIDACNKMQLKVDQYKNTNKKEENNEFSEKYHNEIEEVKEYTQNVDTDQQLKENTDENLDIQAKQESFITNVKNLIQSSKAIEEHLKTKTPTVLQDLQSNLEEILKTVTKLKTDEINKVSDNLEEPTKSRDDVNNEMVTNQSENSTHQCTAACVSKEIENVETKPEEKQQIIEDKSFIRNSTPCDICSESKNEIKEPSNASMCTSCAQPTERIDTPKSAAAISENLLCESSQEQACSSCKKPYKINAQSQIAEEHFEDSSVSSGSNVNYFKKELQKKTKVIRKRKSDGSIWEQTEITTIRKRKQDSKESSLSDDDYEDSSDDSFGERDEKQINLCLISNQLGFVGFLRHSQSEISHKEPPIYAPCVKYCLSVDNFICNTHKYSSSSDCSTETII